jgi:tetratricopeptide (TPR) repeat protein
MRRGTLTVLLLWLGLGLPARAGVYNSAERTALPPWDKLKFWVGELRGVRTLPGARPAPPGSERHRVETQARVLEAREKAGALSTTERADLGACYLRMGRFHDAIRVLEAGDRKHFLILANLATAYYSIDQLDRAMAYQRQALDAWPAVWAGWTFAQLQWYRRAERYFLSLLQLRYREQLRARGRPAPITAVDELFPKVRFVGPDGQYGPGMLAQESYDELPPDALGLALQLVVWLPYDDRLYWLLGELLNAAGQIEVAADVFDDLVYARQMSSVPELVRHRKALKQAVEVIRQLRQPAARNLLLAAAAPRSTLVPPVAGNMTQAASAWVPVLLPPAGPGLAPGQAAVASTSPAAAPPKWLPDWRPLGVGFGAGVVVAVVGALQWREWQRRRRLAPRYSGANGGAAPEGADGVREARQGERGASAP